METEKSKQQAMNIFALLFKLKRLHCHLKIFNISQI